MLYKTPYRKPDVFRPSEELSGGVSQVQRTAHKGVKKIEDIHLKTRPDGAPVEEIGTLKPRQILVIGNLNEFNTDGRGIIRERYLSFEMFRRSVVDVEIITFDELYERSRFIVSDANHIN